MNDYSFINDLSEVESPPAVPCDFGQMLFRVYNAISSRLQRTKQDFQVREWVLAWSHIKTTSPQRGPVPKQEHFSLPVGLCLSRALICDGRCPSHSGAVELSVNRHSVAGFALVDTNSLCLNKLGSEWPVLFVLNSYVCNHSTQLCLHTLPSGALFVNM